MVKADYFVCKYGVKIDVQDTNEEKLRKLATAFGLYESYEGSKPYIFISYAHKDAQLVMPAIKAIQELGYPVWYDAGIRFGDEWAADIARHLKKCKLVIAFASKNYFASPNCRAEVVYAFSNQKQILTVRMDKTPLPEGLDMHLSLSQMFDGFSYSDGDAFVSQLAHMPILSEYVGPILLKEIQEKKRKAEEMAQRKLEQERRQREVERRLQEEERKRKKQEEIEQKRREKEEAELALRREEEQVQRLLHLEREARQKRLQEEIQARIRQEEEMAEEARKRREEEQRERIAREGAQKQREQSKKSIDAAAKCITDLLAISEHEKAIETYLEEIFEVVIGDEELEAYAMPCYDLLCETVYQDALRYESSRKRVARDYAGKLFGALPSNYRDTAKKAARLGGKYEAREKRYGWFVCLVFLALNVFLSRWVLHLIDPWISKLLLMQIPVILVLMLARFGVRVVRVNSNEYIAVVLVLNIVTLIANACLFQGIGFWSKLFWSLAFTVVSALIMFCNLGNRKLEYKVEFSAKVKALK